MKLAIYGLIVLLVFILIGGANMASATPFSSRRKRRQADPSNAPGALDMVAVFTVVATKLRVTVPVPVAQNGLPHVGLSGGAHSGTEYPTAITYISPGVYDLTYANIVAVANVCTYPSRDPALRGSNGSYVAAKTIALT